MFHNCVCENMKLYKQQINSYLERIETLLCEYTYYLLIYVINYEFLF